MIILYGYDKQGLFTGTIEQLEKAPVPRNYTDKSVPDIPEGQHAQYDLGNWRLIDELPPEPKPPAVMQILTMDVLSTDAWSIPADGVTEATVTYTSNDTVYFSANGTIHAVTPVESVATLKISAPAPGEIEVKVRDKQLIIAAVEV